MFESAPQLAQEHLYTGIVAYYLPMEAGSKKQWGRKTKNFWCCHGSLVQAQAWIPSCIYYKDDDGLIMSQYAASSLETEVAGQRIRNAQYTPETRQSAGRPTRMEVEIHVRCEEKTVFRIRVRQPAWCRGDFLVQMTASR